MSNDKKPEQTPPETAEQTPEDEKAPLHAVKQPVDLTGDDEEMLVGEDGELLPGPRELLEIEIADLKDRYLRQAAEMENLRKRTERERADIKKYAVSEFARDILPLSDNFQRAIDAVPPEAAQQDEALNSFLEGVKMNERELQKVLERHGVTPLDPKGEKFDPNMHQAVQQVENSELPNNTVCEVYQVGYVIAERVLRPAVVAVAKGGTKIATDQSAPPQNEPPLTLPETDKPSAEPSGTDPAAGAPGANLDKNA